MSQKRVTVILDIKGKQYKFFSIFFSKSDPSFYIYQHLKDERSSLVIEEPMHLLKKTGQLLVSKLKKTQSERGDLTHISVHPNRIYVKKRSKGGIEEHLMEEFQPQAFNKQGFKLLSILTPAPTSHLPIFKASKSAGETISFKWESEFCPQISIYKLEKTFDIRKMEAIILGESEYKFIKADKVHSALVLGIKATTGDPGVWRPNSGIFGKIVNKGPITKEKLKKIIHYNNLPYDISSIPDDDIISDYKIYEDDSGRPRLVVNHHQSH